MNRIIAMRDTVLDALRRGLSHRALSGAAIACATALTLWQCRGALDLGFQYDDWGLLYCFRNNITYLAPVAPEDLARVNAGARDLGIAPWFSSDQLRHALLRPLATLTHQAEFGLYQARPELMHLQNFGWFAALVASVGLLLRRLCRSPAAATLGTVFYALDDSHAPSIAWIAARNTMMSATFGTLALVFHDKACRDAWRPGWFLAPAALALSFASGEAAIFSCAYFAAHLVFIDTGPWRVRALRALPWLSVLAAWAVVYKALGYGSGGSMAYVHPIRDFAAFAHRILSFVPGALAAKLTGFGNAMDWMQPTQGWQWKLPLAVALLACLGHLVRRDRHAVFWLAGMLLGSVPLGITSSERLFIAMGIGGSALIGSIVDICLLERRPRDRWGMRLLSLGAMVLATTHGIYSPTQMPSAAVQWAVPQFVIAQFKTVLAGVPDGAPIGFVNATDYLVPAGLLNVASSSGVPVPAYVRAFYGGWQAAQITRESENSVSVRPVGGFFADPTSLLSRSPSKTWRVGDRIDLRDVSVLVSDVAPDGNVLEIHAIFAGSPTDAISHWKSWNGAHYVDFAFPTVGKSVWVGPH